MANGRPVPSPMMKLDPFAVVIRRFPLRITFPNTH
jgi:hypothetical protein